MMIKLLIHVVITESDHLVWIYEEFQTKSYILPNVEIWLHEKSKIKLTAEYHLYFGYLKDATVTNAWYDM